MTKDSGAAQYGADIHHAIDQLQRAAQAQADEIAAANDRDNGETLGAILGGLAAAFTQHKVDTDGRAVKWRCRFRIYDQRKGRDAAPEADSEYPAEADQPGTWIITSLPAVCSEAAAMARQLHPGGALLGLGAENLAKVLRGFRPTLSRNNGRGTMRFYYDNFESFKDDGNPAYLIRVDIEKETSK